MIPPRFTFHGDFKPFLPAIEKVAGPAEAYPFGAVLYKSMEHPRTSYYILSGWTKLTILNEHGRERTVFYLGPGSLYPLTCIDELFTMDRFLRITTIEDTVVLPVRSQLVRELAQNDAGFSLAAINCYNKMCDQLLARMLLSSYDSADLLISSFLYLYAYHFINPSNIVEMPQDKLADITGFSRTQVVRTVSRLRREGIIETTRGKIIILSMERLAKCCADVINP